MSDWVKVDVPAGLPAAWTAEAIEDRRSHEVLITAFDSSGVQLGFVTVNETVRGFALGYCQVHRDRQIANATGQGWKQRLYAAAIADLQRAVA